MIAQTYPNNIIDVITSTKSKRRIITKTTITSSSDYTPNNTSNETESKTKNNIQFLSALHKHKQTKNGINQWIKCKKCTLYADRNCTSSYLTFNNFNNNEDNYICPWKSF